MIRFGSWPRWLIAPIVGLPLASIAGWWGLDALAGARNRLATLERMIDAGSRPTSRLMSAGAFIDDDRAIAATKFGRTLADAAAAHRLLVERMDVRPVEPGRPALLMAHIALSGREADIVRFARSLEAGAPAIRFATWHVGRTAPGEATVRFEAQPIALWELVP